MKVETVAASFASYRAAVIPTHAPPDQIEECRRAFYAGAYFLLMNVAHNIGDETTDEDEGVFELEKLKAECEAFAATLGMPRPLVAPDIAYTTPDPDQIKPVLQDLGRHIGSGLPMNYGFVLLIFNYGEGGNMFYISSADRADVQTMLREFLRKQTS